MGKVGNRWIAVAALATLLSSIGSALGEEGSAGVAGEPEEITPKPGQVIVLSLRESILLGLKNNLAIAIEGFNPKIRAADVTGAKAVFDPTTFAEVSFDDRREQNRNVLVGEPVRDNEDFNFSVGLRQDLPTGGSYELLFANNRNFNNAQFFNPNGIDLQTAYSSELSLTVVQPLLKNFGVDINRTQIKIAENEREISLDRFRETTMDVITEVQIAYWDLVFALENLKVEQRSLGLAKELAELNRIRVRAGVAAPVEIIQAEADVAAREALVTVAEKQMRDAEDRLKVVLNIPRGGGMGRGRPSHGPGPLFRGHLEPCRGGGRRPAQAAGVRGRQGGSEQSRAGLSVGSKPAPAGSLLPGERGAQWPLRP